MMGTDMQTEKDRVEVEREALRVDLCSHASRPVQALQACSDVLNFLCKGPDGLTDMRAVRLVVQWLATCYLEDET